MAISAMRFNFLDRETNIGVKDFTQLVDNNVYTGFADSNSAVIENIKDNGIMEVMQHSLDDLSKMIHDDNVAKIINQALEESINEISKMELPDTAIRILDSIKKLDSKGLKDFLGDLLKVGSQFLCDNLDFLKLFMLGYALNENIISGLLIALLLSLLDRFCKSFSAEETAAADPLGKLEQVIPNTGTKVTTSNAFSLFSNYYSDFLKSKQPLNLPNTMSQSEALNRIINGDISSVLDSARNGEMSYADRNSLIELLKTQLNNYPPNSVEYRNILQAIGDLSKLPLISTQRRDNNIRYENLNDKLGSYSKNLTKVDLQSVNLVSLSDTEKGLYIKMTELKDTAANNKSLMCTPNDSFSDFDFNGVLPALNTSESDFLLAKNDISDSHRTLDLHPTSAVFLEA